MFYPEGLRQAAELSFASRAFPTWAKRIRKWLRRQEVFVYFDNDVKVHAPFDAQNLALILAGKPAVSAPASINDVTEQARTTWQAWRRSDEAR